VLIGCENDDRRRLLVSSSKGGEEVPSRRGKPVRVGLRRKTRKVVEAREERERRDRRETVDRGVLGCGEMRVRR